MNPTSTKFGKRLISNLIHLGPDEFRRYCFEILKELYQESALLMASETIAIQGIDCYTYDLKQVEVETSFRCLGFHEDGFGQAELKRCIEEIDKFLNSDLKVFSYRLIINRYIKEKDFRNELQEELERVKKVNKAEIVEFLDINGIVKFLFDEMDIELRNSILSANQRFRDDYQVRMEQLFYQTNVPFIIPDSRKRVFSNPIRFIIEKTTKKQPERLTELEYSLKRKASVPSSSKRIWKFIVSEFGFGKTSLLLNIFSHLNQEQVLPIYLPLAQFDVSAFSTDYNICKNILEIILDRKLSQNKFFDKLSISAFRLMLRTRQDLVLMFDGLDEHHYAYREDGLRAIFNCLRDFQPICLFTVRKEFWDERHGDLQKAVGDRFRKHDKIILIEWKNAQIVEFLSRYEKHLQDEESKKRIQSFIEVVNADQYEQFYGDIPKRPLFLKMLVNDISQSEITQKNLAQIYETYLIHKFDLDRDTSVSHKKSSRPLGLIGDRFFKIRQIFGILENATAKMMYNDADGNIVFLNDVRESEILAFVKDKQIELKETVELLENSVLVPIEKRSLKDFRVKFAHKSFQEYFTGRYLFHLLTEPGGRLKDYDWFKYRFSPGVEQFLTGMLETLAPDADEYQKAISVIKGALNEYNEKTALVNQLAGCMGLEIPERKIEVKSMADYFSCFISYSNKDKAFAKKLFEDLQANGVKCWYAPHSMKIGRKIRDSIEEAIRNYDKLLLIISAHSVESDWVEDEVDAAMEKERVSKDWVLFPIRLDDTLKTSNKPWAAKIRRSRHIGDFTDWINATDYQEAFKRLLGDLK